MKLTAIAVLLCIALCSLGAHAQTQPSGEPFTISGNLASSSGNTVANGVQSTFEYSVAPRWQLRIDDVKAGSANASLAEVQWKVPLSAAFKPGKAPSAFANILVGIHAGLGAVVNLGASFAAGAGASIDYQINEHFFVRVMDVTDVYSRGWVPRNQLFGNYNAVTLGPGIGFQF